MDIESLYRDYNIDFVTAGDHKHARAGWVNVECPFCTGNPGYHLGYDLNGDKFVCWRCGGKNAVYAISHILNVEYTKARKIIQDYGSIAGLRMEDKPKTKIRTKAFKLPSNVGQLEERHRKYLEKRGFDPDYLVKEWEIQATGAFSVLKSNGKILQYKNRIIIPYIWEHEMVSFDSRIIRDNIDKSVNKYFACPEERELINRKHILYGRQDKWGETGLCVEGAFDVWRLGFSAFAVSGIKYTAKQLRLMSKLFKRIPVIFDDDPQAIEQANKLVADLKFRGVDAFRVDIKGDPASLSPEEAGYLVKSLL